MADPFPKKQPDKFIPFHYPIGNKRKLSRFFERKQHGFLDILLTRQSSRNLSKPDLAGISELLFYSNKIHSIHKDEDDFILTKRTVPSAGARHPIDLLISMPAQNGIRNLEYYNPIDHTLSELSLPHESLFTFFNEVNENMQLRESCLIWFSIQSKKTSAKYVNPESLYWKDAGALVYCIQLVSKYIGLKSCPLGTLASDSFNDIFNPNELISGGGILIGI